PGYHGPTPKWCRSSAARMRMASTRLAGTALRQALQLLLSPPYSPSSSLRLLRLSVGFFRLLIALRLNQMLAHETGRTSGLVIANGLIDVPVRFGDRAQIAPPVGRLPPLLVEHRRDHLDH